MERKFKGIRCKGLDLVLLARIGNEAASTKGKHSVAIFPYQVRSIQLVPNTNQFCCFILFLWETCYLSTDSVCIKCARHTCKVLYCPQFYNC